LPAERQLEIGHLEAACATWNPALDDCPMVRSGRADDRVRTMFGLLRPHLKNASARDLYDRGADRRACRPCRLTRPQPAVFSGGGPSVSV